MAEQELDRSEQATPYRREEARKKGSVAKSVELVSCLMMFVMAALLYFGLPSAVERFARVTAVLLGNAHAMSFNVGDLFYWLTGVAHACLLLLAPALAALALMGVFSSLLQTGPVFSVFPLKPDFDRINPVSGFRRVFTWKLLVELAKTLLKLAVLVAVVWYALVGDMPDLMRLQQSEPHGYFGALRGLASNLLMKILAVLFIVALLDLVYRRWDYGDRLRMSRRELKDEVKQREGDPRIRARIRELRKELVERSKSLDRVKDADVIITNPRHIAVALVYRRGEMPAPTLLAKGAGDFAARIREMAFRHRVPIVENRSLARSLFRQGRFNEVIPEALFPAVARVLAWVYAARDQAAGSQAARGGAAA